jgi:hypothetical protein
MEASHAVGRVNELLQTRVGRVPIHVSSRVAAIVGDAELAGAFGERTTADSGWAVVFTKKLVCQVTYENSKWDFASEPNTGGAGESTVACRSWGRSTLTGIDIAADEQHNQDHKWNALWGCWLPPRTRVTLRYANGAVIDVTTPRYDERDNVLQLAGELLRSLAADMT